MTEHKKRVDIISLKICKERSFLYEPRRISNPNDSFLLIKMILENSDREKFLVITLNNRNEPTAMEVCSIGTVNCSLIHPREVFKLAVSSNASKIIIAHNHPTGDITPSESDIMTTASLIQASSILEIPIIDHIILGYDTYFSFAENGLI